MLLKNVLFMTFSKFACNIRILFPIKQKKYVILYLKIPIVMTIAYTGLTFWWWRKFICDVKRIG